MKNTPLLVLALLGSMTASHADLLFYEPFDHAAGSTLQDLGTPLGGSGTWADNSSGGSTGAMVVRANGAPVNQEWGGVPAGVPQAGGFLEGERREDNSGHIALASTVTSQFTDGSSIWMSRIAGATLVTGQNNNHHKPNLAIGQGELMDNRAQKANGQAIGGGARYNTESLSAAYWDDQTDPVDAVYEEHRSGDTLGRIRDEALFIARIDFGADNDTVTVNRFDLDPYVAPTLADFNSSSISITSANNLDNASFDTLSFHGSRSNFDEIRIGTEFADVLPADFAPEPSISISSFTPLGGGDWLVGLVGEAGGDYVFYSSPDLVFDPGNLIENLSKGDPGDPGTIGGSNNSVLTLDGTGLGVVRMPLGGDLRNFIRAQTAP